MVSHRWSWVWQTEGARPTRVPVQLHPFPECLISPIFCLMQLLAAATMLPALIGTSQKGYSHIHTYRVPPPGVMCPVVTLAIWDSCRKNWNHEKYKNMGFRMTLPPAPPSHPSTSSLSSCKALVYLHSFDRFGCYSHT